MSDFELDRIWEISDKYCADYPDLFNCNSSQRLYAIEASLSGTLKATEDLHAIIKELESRLSSKQPGLTPKGEPMPQTVEEWRYLYGLAEKGMLEDKEEISRLKQRINKLEQSQ